MNRTYLDHASTSPLRPAALAAMARVMEQSAAGELGDPSRSHFEGLASRVLVEQARADIAAAFGARPREVVLCSGATEAIATVGAHALRVGGRSVYSAVEHSAVRSWAELGQHQSVGVDRTGRVEAEEFIAELEPSTTMAHLQWTNHEVGTTQPVAEVAAACRDRKVLLHVDAAQAAGHERIDFAESGVDLMSISGHKLGGPTGTGVLLVRRGVRIDPLLTGGDQERARRAGMENLAAICGLAAACTEATTQLGSASVASALTDRLLAWVTDNGPQLGIELLGSREHRSPHIVCLSIAGIEPQPILIGLDRANIAVHSGNSCSSEALEPSPVLAAMGLDAHRSLRVSVGWNSTDRDIDHFCEALPNVVADLRRLA